MTDWLDMPEDARQAQVDEGRRIARLYTVFVTDERGRELLAMWDRAFLNMRTPVNAPHSEYAYNEGRRALIAGIHDQIRIASQP